MKMKRTAEKGIKLFFCTFKGTAVNERIEMGFNITMTCTV